MTCYGCRSVPFFVLSLLFVFHSSLRLENFNEKVLNNIVFVNKNLFRFGLL